MNGSKSPEFDLQRPLASTAALLRAIFLGPRTFYVNFDARGPTREPTLFVLLVSTVTGVLSLVVSSIFTVAYGGDASLPVVAGLNLAYIVLSPVLVGMGSGAYLLSSRMFIGKAPELREVYRIFAYAYGAMILFWVPLVNTLAFVYAAMILMMLGMQSVYRTSFLTALITSLVGFVLTSLFFIYLLDAANGLAYG
ncbi:MAG: YIP1 family protein [Rubrobacter sp.]|nr:YIP1 family protein [Rubrobacter sp.]